MYPSSFAEDEEDACRRSVSANRVEEETHRSADEPVPRLERRSSRTVQVGEGVEFGSGLDFGEST